MHLSLPEGGSSRLLARAKALREAQEIRAYVSAVRDRQATLDDPLSEADFQYWASWALSQADRIEPGSLWQLQDNSDFMAQPLACKLLF